MADYITFQPSDNFNPSTYVGNSSSAEIPVTGVGFQPDLVWAKNRDATYDHFLFDSARGATKYWKTNSSVVAATNAQTLKSFDADGYTMGTDSDVNQSTSDFSAWSWKMGTTSGLTGGTLTPTAYSLNTTAGQSILAYTGLGSAQTIPHGLGAVPHMIMVKCLTGGSSGMVYHARMNNGVTPADYYMKIDGASNQDDAYGSGTWNDTLPTSTVFSVGGNNHTSDTFDYIAYCFTSIPGYSKFSNYMGNGNADGPFIYTGFRPNWLMIKSYTNASRPWYIFDGTNKGKNAATNGNCFLEADGTAVEDCSGDFVDLLSNGFKIRNTTANLNQSTSEFIYAAFAEFPFVASNSTVAVAR